MRNSLFPSLGGEKLVPEARQDITWNISTSPHLDPHTNQYELEVQRIIHLQDITNNYWMCSLTIRNM
jgi:hypothetical protein